MYRACGAGSVVDVGVGIDVGIGIGVGLGLGLGVGIGVGLGVGLGIGVGLRFKGLCILECGTPHPVQHRGRMARDAEPCFAKLQALRFATLEAA